MTKAPAKRPGLLFCARGSTPGGIAICGLIASPRGLPGRSALRARVFPKAPQSSKPPREPTPIAGEQGRGIDARGDQGTDGLGGEGPRRGRTGRFHPRAHLLPAAGQSLALLHEAAQRRPRRDHGRQHPHHRPRRQGRRRHRPAPQRSLHPFRDLQGAARRELRAAHASAVQHRPVRLQPPPAGL